MGIIIRLEPVGPPGDNDDHDIVLVLMMVVVMMMVAVMVTKMMMVVVLMVEIRLERVRPPGDYSLQAKSGSAVGCVCLV